MLYVKMQRRRETDDTDTCRQDRQAGLTGNRRAKKEKKTKNEDATENKLACCRNARAESNQ